MLLSISPFIFSSKCWYKAILETRKTSGKWEDMKTGKWVGNIPSTLLVCACVS